MAKPTLSQDEPKRPPLAVSALHYDAAQAAFVVTEGCHMFSVVRGIDPNPIGTGVASANTFYVGRAPVITTFTPLAGGVGRRYLNNED